MKKFSFRFKITEDVQVAGAVGILPLIFENKGWDSYLPNFSPAHDLIEHTRNENGFLWQELQALGAFLNVRAFNNPFEPIQTDSLASDVVSSFRDAYHSENNADLELPKVPKFNIYEYSTAKINRITKNLLDRIKDYIDSELDDETEINEHFLVENYYLILNHIKYGFYKSQKRWGDCDVFSLFEKINSVCIKESTRLSEYNGTDYIFTLKCEVDEYYSNAEIVYPYNWM